eukprot:Sdes_comp21844_c0_seq1m20398
MMELALIQYALHTCISRGFTPISTPDICKNFVLEGCGFQPRGNSTQIYSVQTHSKEQSHSSLVGTAEIPLAGLHMDTILPEETLPRKLVAFGRCYRAEAGSYGATQKGLYRVHQFSKVELFAVSSPNECSEKGKLHSELMHEEILRLQMDLFDGLGLKYRVLDMATGDLGVSAYRKFDIEAYLPGKKAWGEISSASNCLDYQSRRLLIQGSKKRYSKPFFCHTINGTAAAIPRLMIALLETHQQEDGSVIVPQPLQMYMGGKSVITPNHSPCDPTHRQ